jgi:hypothetical protein
MRVSIPEAWSTRRRRAADGVDDVEADVDEPEHRGRVAKATVETRSSR